MPSISARKSTPRGCCGFYGAHRRYDRLVVLEDARAVGSTLEATLLQVSRTHTVDLLLLVHGEPGHLLGHRGEHRIGAETFARLLSTVRADPASLDLRMVYGLNCYGATLAPTWLALGAVVANGSLGINWFPEPSLSVFLHRWLRGELTVRPSATATRWPIGGGLASCGCGTAGTRGWRAAARSSSAVPT